MLESLNLFKNIIKKGEKKGELNTVKKKMKFIFRTILTLKSSLHITFYKTITSFIQY